MPKYKLVARYFAYAECDVFATNLTDARMQAMNKWPETPWQVKYGGVDFRTPDGAQFISVEIKETQPDPEE